MEILATGWGPTREAAIAFFEACLIAVQDAITGHLIPVADVVIHPSNALEQITVTKIVDGQEVTVPGWHFNLKFYGNSAYTLTAGLAQSDEHGNQLGLFERTRILGLVAARVAAPSWVEVTIDGVPAGYAIDAPGEAFHGVRCFDPVTIQNRVNVFQ